DQITKWLATTYLETIGFSAFIPGFISFQYVLNPGAAWGMLKNHPWIFLSLSTLAIVGIIVFMVMHKQRHTLLTLSLSFILGGGIGNMIDRIFYGKVVDFLHFEWIQFPTFNIADSAITIGGILMLVWVIFIDFPCERRKEKEKKAQANQLHEENYDISDS
ncbi:MAG TPA: signal peptidase II, partial [Clostridiales bacterium]|nr:signal peptidase II [Clostridiales bacterium]